MWAMAGAPERSSTPPVVVLVAVVGLLSTVGAAALGGYWTNQSVKRELDAQRTSEIQDQRREVYVDYLRTATQACLASGTTDEDYNAAVVEVLNQQGRVLLIAEGRDLQEAVDEFTDGVISGEACSSDEVLLALRDAFIEAAQPDLE
jgi:hypothetical protein